MSVTSFPSFHNSIERLVSVINDEMKRVIPADSFPNLYDGVEYALSSGGKRLRPALCILVCEALGGAAKAALPAAAAIEIVHNATLVHDDIEDGDELRRGKPTVWSKFGVPHATNIGDAMIFKSYECVFDSTMPADGKVELCSKITKTLLEITEGQNMEFNFRERDDVNEDEYLDMARKKAGLLFGLSLEAGAIAASASAVDVPEKTKSLLYEFGSDIGLAFMIRDDVLNLTGEQDKYGKEIGGDIKEGKRTLIIIHCLSECSEDEREIILRILKKARREVSDDEVRLAISLLKKHGSIDYAQNYSENLVKDAKEKLNTLENKRLKQLLEELSDFMIKREF